MWRTSPSTILHRTSPSSGRNTPVELSRLDASINPDGSATGMVVEIRSDIVCPCRYIRKRRFEAALARFEHAAQVEVRWRSFELDPHPPVQNPRTIDKHHAASAGGTI